LDGLLDYGEDFTDAALVVENLQTTYKVGKGMMAHVEEMARQAEAEEIEEVELAQSEEPEVQAEKAETEVSLAEEDHELTETDVADAPDEIDTVVAAPRRRMQFTFEDHQTG
jgi:hypothetical protein